MLKKDDIKALIPHRAPFLWIDEIIEIEPGTRCVGLKKIAPSADFFRGHFPGEPILPGIYIIEASAQVGGVMLAGGAKTDQEGGKERELKRRLAAVNTFKFIKPVLPGQILRIETKLVTRMAGMAYIEALVSVEDYIVAKGEISLASF